MRSGFGHTKTDRLTWGSWAGKPCAPQVNVFLGTVVPSELSALYTFSSFLTRKNLASRSDPFNS